MHAGFETSETLEQEFNKPVETIMRCEDFKSNFARRLSNRYISKLPVTSPKQDSSLKLCFPDSSDAEKVSDNVRERIEPDSQLSKNSNVEPKGGAAMLLDKHSPKKSDVQKIEVAALNMEVETLRWQLTQTEANRQMYIALLRQIVSFLNRVKEHIECQNKETGNKKETLSTCLLPQSFNFSDLPRSRSVVHVNKNFEGTFVSSKKMNASKIGKSISNVNRYKDCNGIWSQSKISLTPESDNTQKLSEEMTRLINLANSMLSTKLPDLACNDKMSEENFKNLKDNTDVLEQHKINLSSINGRENDSNITNILKTIGDCKDKYTDNADNFILPTTCEIENEFSVHLSQHSSLIYKDDSSIRMKSKTATDKGHDFSLANFIEDESGFSSMNSFQEIGIPIISIIPPSPCKEMDYKDDFPEILNESEKWKVDALDLDKQTIKVFWV